MKRLVRGATVIHSGIYKREDVLICNGKIEQIKEFIPCQNGTEIIDGSDYFILPGFISSYQGDLRDQIGQGITTRIKEIELTEHHVSQLLDREEQKTNEKLDFVYQVHLQEWDKKTIEWLGNKGMKLISVSRIPSEPQSWIPQLQRLGFVLDTNTQKRQDVEKFHVPLVATYPSHTRPKRARMVIRIQEPSSFSWFKQAVRKKTLFPASYWLDVYALQSPLTESEEQLKQMLLLLSHVRSRVPAKLLGIFPQKGSIAIGGDADLLFFNRSRWFQLNEQIIPEKVMIRGKWAHELLACQSEYSGSYLQGNRTYAFDF